MNTPHYWQEAKQKLAANDPVLAKLLQSFDDSIPLQSANDPCLTLTRAIVGQQISTTAADAIWQRLLTHCDGTITAQALLANSTDVLRKIGLSQRKATYLHGIAQAMQQPDYSFEALQQLDDQQVTKHLCQLHGIGPWSAEMVLMFCLLRPNILPVRDLGLQRAVKQHYLTDHEVDMTPPQIINTIKTLSAQWQPFCTVATWYLWRSIDDTTVQY